MAKVEAMCDHMSYPEKKDEDSHKPVKYHCRIDGEYLLQYARAHPGHEPIAYGEHHYGKIKLH